MILENLRNNIFFKCIEKHEEFPFVVVAPLCSEETWFDVFETLKRQKSNKEPPNLILFSVIRMYTEMYAVMRQHKSGMSKERIAASLKIHEFKVGKYISRISKMSPQRIERSLELCMEADVSSKTYGNLTGYIAVERLVSMLILLRGNL